MGHPGRSHGSSDQSGGQRSEKKYVNPGGVLEAEMPRPALGMGGCLGEGFLERTPRVLA